MKDRRDDTRRDGTEELHVRMKTMVRGRPAPFPTTLRIKRFVCGMDKAKPTEAVG